MTSKKNKKVRFSLSEKILAILSIVSFIIIIAGVIQKHWGSSEQESIPKPSKVQQTDNENR